MSIFLDWVHFWEYVSTSSKSKHQTLLPYLPHTVLYTEPPTPSPWQPWRGNLLLCDLTWIVCFPTLHSKLLLIVQNGAITIKELLANYSQTNLVKRNFYNCYFAKRKIRLLLVLKHCSPTSPITRFSTLFAKKTLLKSFWLCHQTSVKNWLGRVKRFQFFPWHCFNFTDI